VPMMLPSRRIMKTVNWHPCALVSVILAWDVDLTKGVPHQQGWKQYPKRIRVGSGKVQTQLEIIHVHNLSTAFRIHIKGSTSCMTRFIDHHFGLRECSALASYCAIQDVDLGYDQSGFKNSICMPVRGFYLSYI